MKRPKWMKRGVKVTWFREPSGSSRLEVYRGRIVKFSRHRVHIQVEMAGELVVRWVTPDSLAPV